ncbi:hypothetical protein SAMN04489712_102597 [Thermomonospora echinospora]|uniref:Uncharacterized protein n=1 Tax=Thermomonospora echinospora TaxID=1992 RepID=A0A1H5W5J7_9ACTN|nr:hypothetical protein SAMN04489712_102597 [Thermomonospora echinospora]
MGNPLNRLADWALAQFMPRGEASAAMCDPPICGCWYRTCYCRNSKAYQKLCDGGCNGIPVFCQADSACRHINTYCA